MSKKSATKSKAVKQVVEVVESAAPEKEILKPLSAEQQKALEAITSISGKIRYLDGQQFSRGQIAKHVGKRYQHVRNVLETPLKRKPVKA